MHYAPFKTKVVGKEILLEKNDITFSMENFDKAYVYIRAGLRIGASTVNKETRLLGSEKEIIKQIHAIRFNKENPYVITGGHFYQLFVRNLGVFYNTLLDPRIPSSDTDWLRRQEIALKTVALDLEIFRLAGKEYTTIIPVRKNVFSCLDIYARPSDSLFAILYTLLALTDDKFIETLFPAKGVTKHQLQTKKAGQNLYEKYKKTLIQLIQNYYEEVIDTKTGLVKTHLLLAGARDGIKRESSFYDNVIAWATINLAKELDIYDIDKTELKTWQKRITRTFWDTKEGLFLDDLSKKSKKEKFFSADSFIVLSTGFLNPQLTDDKKYLGRMIEYVKRNQLDVPFPLHYSSIDLPEKLYRQVRHFAPSYMGTSIWSHWGMEYIKTLIYVGQLSDAKSHLEMYKQNIETYGGYPEVYDSHGKLLKTRLYRSVLHNGWVINYEQTKMLLTTAENLFLRLQLTY